jgi:hypothetical protein
LSLRVQFTHPCSAQVPQDSVTRLLSVSRAGYTRTAAVLGDKPLCSANSAYQAFARELELHERPSLEIEGTHAHASWRNFEAIPLQAVPPGRYEITFTDGVESAAFLIDTIVQWTAARARRSLFTWKQRR